MTRTPLYDAVKAELQFDPSEVDTSPLDYKRLCAMRGLDPEVTLRSLTFPPLHPPARIDLEHEDDGKTVGRGTGRVPEQRQRS